MDCKVICGFDLLVVKCFTVCIILLSEIIEKLTEHCLGLELIQGFWKGQPTVWGGGGGVRSCIYGQQIGIH